MVKRHAMLPVGGGTDILTQTLSILVVEDDPGDFGLVDRRRRYGERTKAGLAFALHVWRALQASLADEISGEAQFPLR